MFCVSVKLTVVVVGCVNGTTVPHGYVTSTLITVPIYVCVGFPCTAKHLQEASLHSPVIASIGIP